MKRSLKNIDMLVILMVSELQAPRLMDSLSKNKYYFTKIDSTGGVIQESAICLVLGINSERLSQLNEMINQCCSPVLQYIPAQMVSAPPELAIAMVEAKVGGAVLYTMHIERFEQI